MTTGNFDNYFNGTAYFFENSNWVRRPVKPDDIQKVRSGQIRSGIHSEIKVLNQNDEVVHTIITRPVDEQYLPYL